MIMCDPRYDVNFNRERWLWILDQRKRNGISEKVCFLELEVCIFPLVNVLDGDALYSSSDPSDLDMVKMEAKLPLYDHKSCSDLSCSEEDDLEALSFIFGY